VKKKKKKVKVVAPDTAEIADPKMVEMYASRVHKYGRDWHLLHPRRDKILKKLGVTAKQFTDHVVRMGDRHFDAEFRRNIRDFNVSKDRKKDGLMMVWMGSNCLDPGDVLGRGEAKPKSIAADPQILAAKKEVKKLGKVQKALTEKWQSSDRLVKMTGLKKPKVIKIVKRLVTNGIAEKRKKEDGTFQYRLKRDQ
jgi:hypothetical protein